MFEGDAIAHVGRQSTVDFLDTRQQEIFLAFVWRSNFPLDDVACLQAVFLDLRHGDVDIVGGGEVIVIARANEAIVVGHDFEYAINGDEIFEAILLGCLFRQMKALLGFHGRDAVGGIVEDVVVGQCALIFDG